MVIENHATFSRKSGEFDLYKEIHSFNSKLCLVLLTIFAAEERVFCYSQSALKGFRGVCSCTKYSITDCVFCCACSCMPFFRLGCF